MAAARTRITEANLDKVMAYMEANPLGSTSLDIAIHFHRTMRWGMAYHTAALDLACSSLVRGLLDLDRARARVAWLEADAARRA